MAFVNRADAGRRLANALLSYKEKRPVVLALPRGGVPVAAEICARLDAPIDLLLVRKIGMPRHPELAMGAVVDGAAPSLVRNENIIARGGITKAEFDAVYKSELAEIERRRLRLLGSRHAARLKGRVVIVVDDGIATGATMRVALQAVRQQEPRELVLAVPVAPASTLEELRAEVDAVVCLEAPADFDAVGRYYRDFRQLEDEDVLAILASIPDDGSA